MGEQARRCPDCGSAPGEFHSPGCDVERCAYCGRQSISCDCSDEQGRGGVAEVDRLPWTGIWPGVAECEKHNIWCKMGPHGWQPCSMDDPEARHDLNRLYTDFQWDRKCRTYVPKNASLN